jgi:hypothetical protein
MHSMNANKNIKIMQWVLEPKWHKEFHILRHCFFMNIPHTYKKDAMLNVQRSATFAKKAAASSKLLESLYQNTEPSILLCMTTSNFTHLSKPTRKKSDTMNFRAANILYHEPVGAISYFTTWIWEERNMQRALGFVQYNTSFPSDKLHYSKEAAFL